VAEKEGFEPSIGVSPYSGLANRRPQPLGDFSALDMLRCAAIPTSATHEVYRRDWAVTRTSLDRFRQKNWRPDRLSPQSFSCSERGNEKSPFP
jgi:hypothetical protein